MYESNKKLFIVKRSLTTRTWLKEIIQDMESVGLFFEKDGKELTENDRKIFAQQTEEIEGQFSLWKETAFKNMREVK